MITVNIRPSKSRFGIRPRKQWKAEVSAGNGERLDFRETYANTGAIVAMLHALREDPMTIRIHHEKGVETIELPANPPSPF